VVAEDCLPTLRLAIALTPELLHPGRLRERRQAKLGNRAPEAAAMTTKQSRSFPVAPGSSTAAAAKGTGAAAEERASSRADQDHKFDAAHSDVEDM
jgi:hypothetical protein